MKSETISGRRIAIALIISISLIVSGCFTGAPVYGTEKPETAEAASEAASYAEDELIVVFEEDVSEPEMEGVVEDLEGEDAEVLQENAEITALVSLPEEQSVEEAVREYEEDPDVAFAQPNFRYELTGNAGTTATNDTNFSQLWHLTNIQAEAAWNLAAQVSGHKKTRVAVLDTGVVYNHPDLAGNLNRSLCADTSSGRSTVSLTGDNDGHGTHVSGIVGAIANNSAGVAGVGSGKDNSSVELFVVDVFVGSGDYMYAYTDAVVRGINYASSKGAKVINMSLGYYGWGKKTAEDLYLERTINNAVKKNITVVCAAGNENTSYPSYPSDFSACVSVIATDRSNVKSTYSDYGSAKDISAPGDGILSTYLSNQYASLSGTSMAAPVVSGVAALVYSVNPTLTTSEVKSILYTTATGYTPGVKSNTKGYGVVNAKKAVEKAIASRNVTSVKLTGKVIGKGSSSKLSLAVGPRSAVNKAVTWTSSNPEVATVDSSGNVKGISYGTAVIKATSASNPTVSGSATVTIGYNIKYVLNSGKNSASNPPAYAVGKSVALKSPARRGYTFAGWYTSAAYTQKITSVAGGDRTVYAKWKKVTVGKAAIKKIKRTSKTKMKVYYKKVSGVKGYEIKYSRYKKFPAS